MRHAITKYWASVWGLSGIALFLLAGVYRVWPDRADILNTVDVNLAIILLAVFLPLMIYLEAYKGFHKSFTPRVVTRAMILRQGGSNYHKVLAPLFCMGFIHSTLRRKISLYSVSLVIFILVLSVRYLAQPWRWVIDVSVAVALLLGVITIFWSAAISWFDEELLTDPELPY